MANRRYKNLFYKKNKSASQRKNSKGLSTIVTTVILVAISIVAVALVWTFVGGLINKQIGNSKSCYGNTDKITLNKQYTCYEQIGTSSYKLRFSIGIQEVQVDKVVVSVSSGGAVKGYTITNTPQIISGLTMYSGANPTMIVLPGQDSGLTYNATGFTNVIDKIEITPTINGNSCGVSDSYSEIENCLLLT